MRLDSRFGLLLIISLTTEIPTQQVQYAQVVLAVFLHNNTDALGLSGLEDYKNVKIGSIDVTPNLMTTAPLVRIRCHR
jgi:hypothetical protein